MPVIQSLRQLQRVGADQQSPGVYTPEAAITPLGALSYRSMYRQQPEVRVVVDFIARNMAQIGVGLYERVGDTDRRRVTDHPVVRALERPNRFTTRYRLIERTMIDVCVMGHGYWVKVHREDGDLRAIVRVPPERIAVVGDPFPIGYLYQPPGGGDPLPLQLDQVVHFEYTGGETPLETLKRILAEQRAAVDYRTRLWQNDAKIGGVIERPLEAGWTKEARDRWRSQFTDRFTGVGNAGKVLILEDGMKFREVTRSSADVEWSVGYKLNREIVAAQYHIPLPMVGILDHATFSNIREQHRHLYQDGLGPWCVMIAEEMELQLLRDYEDPDEVDAPILYLEFNIAAKLAGSFEEQSAAFQTAVGGPWMTRNEARARQNLPRDPDPDADRVLAPLNMGGRTDATRGAAAAAGGGSPAREPEGVSA